MASGLTKTLLPMSRFHELVVCVAEVTRYVFPGRPYGIITSLGRGGYARQANVGPDLTWREDEVLETGPSMKEWGLRARVRAPR